MEMYIFVVFSHVYTIEDKGQLYKEKRLKSCIRSKASTDYFYFREMVSIAIFQLIGLLFVFQRGKRSSSGSGIP